MPKVNRKAGTRKKKGMSYTNITCKNKKKKKNVRACKMIALTKLRKEVWAYTSTQKMPILINCHVSHNKECWHI